MKVVLPRLGSGGFGSVAKINEMMAAIEAAFENTLSRDGDTPNQLQFDLDLNGFNIINSGASDSPTRLVSFQEMTNFVKGASTGLVIQKVQVITATASQTVFTLTDFAYSPGTNNLAVYVDGVRKISGTDYTETSASVVTFTVGLSVGQKATFVNNEFVGNISLPTHTHPWSQITGVPVFTTRWPDWTEVTGKPATFIPAAHVHSTADITSGTGLADARRGIWVQSSQPTAGRIGELWFW